MILYIMMYLASENKSCISSGLIKSTISKDNELDVARQSGAWVLIILKNLFD